MHILHETWRCYWLIASDVNFWSVVFVLREEAPESLVGALWTAGWAICVLELEAAGSDRNWSRFRWCWKRCSACWFFPFKRWAVKAGFLQGEKELKGLNTWELNSALWRGAFSAVVFVVRWKDGVDREWIEGRDGDALQCKCVPVTEKRYSHFCIF